MQSSVFVDLNRLRRSTHRSGQADTPLGRLERPDDVVGVVTFLASSAADIIAGESININGGAWMTEARDWATASCCMCGASARVSQKRPHLLSPAQIPPLPRVAPESLVPKASRKQDRAICSGRQVMRRSD